MRTIRILFAIFSFSIFSHDLQLRSSDLFRFSAADLGGLGVAVADGCNAPSVATEAIAAIAPLRAFRLLIFFFFLQPVLYCNLHARFRKPTSEAFWTNKT